MTLSLLHHKNPVLNTHKAFKTPLHRVPIYTCHVSSSERVISQANNDDDDDDDDNNNNKQWC
jgi:hypothetical protein